MKTTLKKLIISGNDAANLLQRVITQDIQQCNKPTLSALCNAKGKVILTFWVENSDHLSIWIEQTLVSDLLKHLKYYDPFCQLQFHLEGHIVWSSKDFIFTNIESRDPTPWSVFLIQQGIITLYKENQGKYTPQMLNLDKLNAICLTKGCFVGYEPITKTSYRGKTKRRLVLHEAKHAIVNVLNSATLSNKHYGLVLESTTQ